MLSLKSYLFCLFFLSLCSWSFGQNKETKKGNKKFRHGHYNSAIQHYREALNQGVTDYEIYYRIAESYRLSNRLYLAKDYYESYIKLNSEPNIKVYYQYAFSLKNNGLYQEAIKNFNKFLDKVDTESPEYKRAREEVRLLQKLEDMFDKNDSITISNVSWINSEFDEYSPVFTATNLLFFSTTHNLKDEVFETTGTGYSKIHYTKINIANLEEEHKIATLPSQINTKGVNEGTLAFYNKGKSIVFARGNTKKRGKEVDLWVSHWKDGKWRSVKTLHFSGLGYWDSSPAFSQNEKYLYFASNRPGGHGGIDLYRVLRGKDDAWGKPQNMGSKINTAGNDMFPYISAKNELYYASDGREGFGGLDLFVARREKGKTVVKNLGYRFNSPFDDFGIFYVSDTLGFFSSNRPGSMGNDDIYAFFVKKPKIIKQRLRYLLHCTVISEKSQEPIPEAQVQIFNAETSKKLADQLTQSSGTIQYPIKRNNEYSLMVSRERFLTKRFDFSAKGLPEFTLRPQTSSADSVLYIKVALQNIAIGTIIELKKKVPIDSLNATPNIVLDSLNKMPNNLPPLLGKNNGFESGGPIAPQFSIIEGNDYGFEEIYYDYDKALIKQESLPSLNKVVNFLKDNPSVKVEISSHADSRGTDLYNLKLSQRRAESVVYYLSSKGIAKSRLKARGYGEFVLKKDNAQTEQDHSLNRRTELKIIGFVN